MKQIDPEQLFDLNNMLIQYSTEIAVLEKKILELQYEKEKVEAEIKRLSTKIKKYV